MDWIERWWGLNPDGGNGTVEAWIITMVAVVIALGVAMRSATVRASVSATMRALLRRSSTPPSR